MAGSLWESQQRCSAGKEMLRPPHRDARLKKTPIRFIIELHFNSHFFTQRLRDMPAPEKQLKTATAQKAWIPRSPLRLSADVASLFADSANWESRAGGRGRLFPEVWVHRSQGG